MPKMCTLFSLVDIKKRSFLITCVFWFVFLNASSHLCFRFFFGQNKTVCKVSSCIAFWLSDKQTDRYMTRKRKKSVNLSECKDVKKCAHCFVLSEKVFIFIFHLLCVLIYFLKVKHWQSSVLDFCIWIGFVCRLYFKWQADFKLQKPT